MDNPVFAERLRLALGMAEDAVEEVRVNDPEWVQIASLGLKPFEVSWRDGTTNVEVLEGLDSFNDARNTRAFFNGDEDGWVKLLAVDEAEAIDRASFLRKWWLEAANGA
jgi:hypothetical protein